MDMQPTETRPELGARFSFGQNWAKYSAKIDSSRIEAAAACLRCGIGDLRGRTFLDIGCGSGVHSLAAAYLGATKIHSFDYDPDAVAVAAGIRERFAPQANWTIDAGSVLDSRYLERLGTFDVVYAWGVLHHTGDMWQALENTASLVAPQGSLFVALYNNQGCLSLMWRSVKRQYVRSGRLVRKLLETSVWCARWGARLAIDLLALRPIRTFRTYRDYWRLRGMSPWHDIVDWVGGYPFEVASPETVIAFHQSRGFVLTRLKTCGRGMGCNEFVFQRSSD